MKKLFSYLLISSMVVLSSCTNYDDQFDDLNSQINSLKGQIEGFSSLSSGLTALQGTVSSLQSAVAALPTTTTDISGLEASLLALSTTVETLQANLANAATAAEVAALQTALTAAQSDLTELLASNNVYSDNLVISSAATLAVAKSLGGKLAIINGDVTITQSSSLSAADLQEVLDVMVTVTGDISYSMTVNSSTQATFDNLTSVDGLTLDVAGDINFPLLENAGVVTLNTTHKNYVTSVEFPVLSTVTSFYTGTDADAIDFPKATAITLSALKNYVGVASDLTIGGKLNFTLDLAALTSVKASGAKNAIDLTIKGAAELSLPEFTDGNIIANTTAKVVLPKFKGSGTDSFTKASYLHLAAYEQNVVMGSEVSTSLDTLLFTGVIATGEDNGPSLSLGAATGLSTLTVDGTINSLTLTGNTSLSEVSLTGKANAITVSGASSLEELTLAHTAADAELASLSVSGNESLSSLTVSALVSAKSLIITDNDSLETLEFTALKTQGGEATDEAEINISDNNLTASSIEMTVAPTTTDKDGTGSVVTESGLDTLEAYIGAAATRYASVGGTIYVAFDTVEVYTGVNGEPSTSPSEWNPTTPPAETILVDLRAGTTTGDAAFAAVRSIIVDDLDNDIVSSGTAADLGVNAEDLIISLNTEVTEVTEVDDLYTDVTAHIASDYNKTILASDGYSAIARKHWSDDLYENGSDAAAIEFGVDGGGDDIVLSTTATFTVNFNGIEYTGTLPAAVATDTYYGVSPATDDEITDEEFAQMVANIINDMDNTAFDADTYSQTTTLSSTTDLEKWAATEASGVITIELDHMSPMAGLSTNLDITLEEDAGLMALYETKTRILEFDYDTVLVTVTALTSGLDNTFELDETHFTQFDPVDYVGHDTELYEASTVTTAASFIAYIANNGGGPVTSEAKATKQLENVDNYPRGVHVVATESTLEAATTAGTKNYSAWL